MPRQATKQLKLRDYNNPAQPLFYEMLEYQMFMCLLIGKFSRNPYFERTRGETVLLPKEQETVLFRPETSGSNRRNEVGQLMKKTSTGATEPVIS